jgi:hypothetical protein
MRITKRAAAVLGALALAAPLVAQPASGAATTGPTAIVAKTCGTGYTHAVIGGAEKCLRRGEFCAHRYDRQYRRYGFRCIRRDARGNYHLT